jgi:DNA polymerase III delta prime subunit
MHDVTVTGNDNFVIVAGGDVYVSTVPGVPPSGDDRRNLVNLLGHVRRIWISNVLERSVSHATLLDPRGRMEPDAVEAPWRRYLEAARQPPRLLPPDVRISRVFEQVGRMLLILGEPGAGKTTTLLTLTRECIQQAERDSAAPVPVVLNLSSWTGARPFRDWLVGELSKGYRLGKALARRWLEGHRLLLLLDGLDEVAEERRAACVRALHGFVEEHGVPGMAVCCRTAEYRALPLQLKLGGAVLLLPLEPAQIDAYLRAAGPALDGLRGALAGDAELRELCESPLMLSIMTLAFHGLPAGALRFDEASTREELRDEIFGRFVDRMFTLRDRPDARFTRRRVKDGLRWLAAGMKERGSIFAIELLQPAWLTRRRLGLYVLTSRILISVVLGLGTMGLGTVAPPFLERIGRRIGGVADSIPHSSAQPWLTPLEITNVIFHCVVISVVVGLICFPLDYVRLRRPAERRERPTYRRALRSIAKYFTYMLVGTIGWLLTGIAMYLLAGRDIMSEQVVANIGLYIWLFFPLVIGMREGRGRAEREIGAPGPLAWQWKAAAAGAAKGAIASIFLTPLLIISAQGNLGWAALGMLLISSVFAMYSGWRASVPSFKSAERIRPLSWKANAIRGAIYVPVLLTILLLVINLFAEDRIPFVEAVFAGLFMSVSTFSVPALFWFGGAELVLHVALRLVLALTGTVPLRLRRFLDYAVHLGFLQRTGGGYIFFHRLLLEHFAARYTPSNRSVTKRPDS